MPFDYCPHKCGKRALLRHISPKQQKRLLAKKVNIWFKQARKKSQIKPKTAAARLAAIKKYKHKLFV